MTEEGEGELRDGAESAPGAPPPDYSRVGAAVVGTGFIRVVHVDALRRLGVQVRGVVGSTPGRAALKQLAPVYERYEDALRDPGVDVVHITTPNDLHHEEALQAMAAGKHVVCEKPLANSVRDAEELCDAADRYGTIACTNLNVRFYPMCGYARELCARGQLGEIWNISGRYVQDYLCTPADWNWRLEPRQGGELRVVADIGTHWLDIVQWISGHRIEQVFALLKTAIPIRHRPRSPQDTFGGIAEIERDEVDVSSEDFAYLLLRFRDGACGSVIISQASAGRKNALFFEINGSRSSVAWDGENVEQLWVGRRDAPNEIVFRDPNTVNRIPGTHSALPAGHAEGYTETFRELYRNFYLDVLAGRRSTQPTYPTFEDGLWANIVVDAIALSSREERWVTVPARPDRSSPVEV